MKHSLSISPKACGIVLATFAVMMNLAATVADIVTQRVRNENMWPVCRQFTFTTEGNLANLYQGLQLLFCAALLMLIWRMVTQAGGAGGGPQLFQ